jgi:transcriptional regulator with XRE-family HTH domain
MAANELGRKLREARERQDRSLSDVVSQAGISTAYLQKLEAGGVKGPSPNVLFKIAQALKLEYAELMRLADYVVPAEKQKATRRRNELTYALSSEELTDEEARELQRYLDFFRKQKKRAAS